MESSISKPKAGPSDWIKGWTWLVAGVLIAILVLGSVMFLLLSEGDEEPGASPYPGAIQVGDYLKSTWVEEGDHYENIATVLAINGSGYDCRIEVMINGVTYQSQDYYANNWSDFILGPLGDWMTPLAEYEGNDTIDTPFGPRLVDIYEIDSRDNPDSMLMPGVYHFSFGVNNRILYQIQIDIEGSDNGDYEVSLAESNISWV